MKIIVMFWLFINSIYGCMWLDGFTIDGKYLAMQSPPRGSIYIQHNIDATPIEILREYRDINKSSKEYEAVKLITQFKSKEAIAILLEIEAKRPALYTTATNLALAYELSGEYEEAIRWMKEALKRNKDSHYGTEWLHLFILKSKVKFPKESGYLEHNLLIKLPKKFDKESIIEIDDKNYSIRELEKALTYQLKERVIFVKPKDEIVAHLFYTLAMIYEHTTILSQSRKFLDYAKMYGFDSKHITKKLELYDKIEDRGYIFYVVLVILSIASIILLLIKYDIVKEKTEEKNKKFKNHPLLLAFIIIFNLMFYIFVGNILLSLLFSSVYNVNYDIKSLPYLTAIIFSYISLKITFYYLKKKYIIEDSRKLMSYTILVYILFDGLLLKLGFDNYLLFTSLVVFTMLAMMLYNSFKKVE